MNTTEQKIDDPEHTVRACHLCAQALARRAGIFDFLFPTS